MTRAVPLNAYLEESTALNDSDDDAIQPAKQPLHATINAEPVTETDESNQYDRAPLFPAWTRCTQRLRTGVSLGCTFCAMKATKRPKTTIFTFSSLSLLILLVGFFFGNFQLVLDLNTVFTPIDSLPAQHYEWLMTGGTDGGAEGGPVFPPTRLVQIIFHNHGANILHKVQARRVIEAIDAIQSTPQYPDFCEEPSGRSTCRLWSVAQFFDPIESNDNETVLNNFDTLITSDDDLRERLNVDQFQGGLPIFHDAILGQYQFYPEDYTNLSPANVTTTHNQTATKQKVLQSAQSYLVRLELPDYNPSETDVLETELLSRLDTLRRQWMKNDRQASNTTNTLAMDILSVHAYQLELLRVVVEDLYLVGVSIITMVACTCLYFYSRDAAKSRVRLGIASMITILCSVMTAFGIMFLCGTSGVDTTASGIFIVGFSSKTQLTILLAQAFRTLLYTKCFPLLFLGLDWTIPLSSQGHFFVPVITASPWKIVSGIP